MWSFLVSVWRNLFQRKTVERELDDELQACLDILIQKQVTTGVPPTEARRRALIELGGFQQVKEEVRHNRMGTMAERTVRELHYAVRVLVRQPWITAALVLTLALGSGATTTVFAVFNAVLFRPIPGVQEADRLVTVYFQPIDRAPAFASIPQTALSSLGKVIALDGLAAAHETTLPLVASPGADPEFAGVEFVTEQYLPLLHVKARAGRLFSEQESAQGANVVLISERLSQRAFGAPTAAIGKQLNLNALPFSVVGVVADYRGWDAVRVGTVDLWVPIAAQRAAGISSDQFFSLVGRLRSGSPLDVLEQQLRAAFAPFATSVRIVQAPPSLMGRKTPFAPAVYSGLYRNGQDEERQAIANGYPFAMGAAGLLLLLACANTSNLLLARVTRRKSDLALRRALGASRGRLAFGLLIEAALVVTAATVVGILLAVFCTAGLRGIQLFQVGPAIEDISIDWRVMAFSAVLSLATVAVFGFLPALSAAMAEPRVTTLDSGRTTTSTHTLRKLLVSVQLALSLTLLAGAGVLTQSLHHLRAVDFGVGADGVVSFSMNPRRLGYSRERQFAVIQAVLDRLESTPGFQAVAFASPSMFWPGRIPARIRADVSDASSELEVDTAVVSSGYFQALDIGMVAGRAFAEAEFQRQAPTHGPAIVSESLAQRLFGNSAVVGRQLSLSQAPKGWEVHRTFEIVGVAQNTRSASTIQTGERFVLYEAAGPNVAISSFFARASTASPIAIAEIRRVARDIEPNLPLTNVGTVRDEIERLLPEDRTFAYLATAVAFLATFLSVTGIYAVVSHSVTERKREFAIRIALGGSAARVAGQVVQQLVIWCIAGTAAGGVLFTALSGTLSSRVYGLAPRDELTLGAVTLILVVTAMTAAWLPAWRASRIDPAVPLRDN